MKTTIPHDGDPNGGREADGLSRRGFVKLAAGAMLAPALAGGAAPLPGPVRPRARGRDVLRIGLIGCGGRGTGAAVQALRADPDTRLTAMADVFPERIEQSLAGMKEALEGEEDRVDVPPERRFVGFDSYRRVIDGDADVVLLTSYPCFRPAHLAAAVAAGKHVFAEKPVAVDGPGLRSVLSSAAEAERRGLGLVIGFCWRFNGGMRNLFQRVAKGALGDVVTVHSTYHATTLQRRPRRPEWSDVEFQMRNWWHFTWISGDHIVEQAVHSIDRLSWAMGDRPPARVTCLGGRSARSGPEHGNVFDHFSAVYEYEDGRRAFHTCTQLDGCPTDNTDYIYGADGLARVNGWTPTYVIRDRKGALVWEHDGSPIPDMYQTEHNELFASLRAGRPLNNGAHGARSTQMAVMARMAAYTGQVITWDQALNSEEDLLPPSLAFGPSPVAPVAVPGRTSFK